MQCKIVSRAYDLEKRDAALPESYFGKEIVTRMLNAEASLHSAIAMAGVDQLTACTIMEQCLNKAENYILMAESLVKHNPNH